MRFEAVSSGKVILLGEHAVVHGVPALAASIRGGAFASVRPAKSPVLQVRDGGGIWTIDPSSELARAYRILSEVIGVDAEADVRIEIPTRAGLGSSACLGVALARAMLQMRGSSFGDSDVVEAATAWERVFHGNPSGIDVAVATFGGCIAFQKSTGVAPLKLASPIPLCVGDTGLRSSTRVMVEHVARVLDAEPDGGRALLDGVRNCVERAKAGLLASDWSRVGHAMNDNQSFLRTLGLSNPEADSLCNLATDAGALAAKVTGAGGGGCVIALAPDNRQDVLDAWQHAGFVGFSVDAGTSASFLTKRRTSGSSVTSA